MAEENPTEKAFAKAAEIAKSVPKHLQEIAFNRALDHLLAPARAVAASGGNARSRQQKDSTPSAGSDIFFEFLNSIDRAKHTDVGSTQRVGDRALKVLELARNDYDRDGLTSQEIATILSQKFRFPVKVSAVNMALSREAACVDFTSIDGVKTFRIMAPGEEYLQKLRSGEVKPTQRKAAPKAGKKKSAAAASPKETPEDESKSQEKPGDAGGTKKARASRPGPKASIARLVASGYFGSRRILHKVQSEIRDKAGHQFSIQELAPALVRLVRDGTLKRERSESGQYEYFVEKNA